MRGHRTIRAGGLALIVGAAAFLGVFAFLAARFDYPAVLDGNAAEVLPKLLATGATGRAVWAIYGLLPILWVPAGVAAFHALRPVSGGSARIGMLFAVIAALSMMLGLLRWPSIHWKLAEEYVRADRPEQLALGAVFTGLNSYLGNYIGEFLGELCFSLFFLFSSIAMWRERSAFPRWVSVLGFATATAGLIGMFRNVTGAVAAVAEINNYLLPVWMIVFGVSLLRSENRRRVTRAHPESTPAASPATGPHTHHAPLR